MKYPLLKHCFIYVLMKKTWIVYSRFILLNDILSDIKDEALTMDERFTLTDKNRDPQQVSVRFCDWKACDFE